MEKITIEKGTVQETLVIPLYGRKICNEAFPELYNDPYADELIAKLGGGTIATDLTKLGINVFGSVNAAEYAILGLISPLLYKFAYDNDGVDDNNLENS